MSTLNKIIFEEVEKKLTSIELAGKKDKDCYLFLYLNTEGESQDGAVLVAGAESSLQTVLVAAGLKQTYVASAIKMAAIELIRETHPLQAIMVLDAVAQTLKPNEDCDCTACRARKQKDITSKN